MTYLMRHCVQGRRRGEESLTTHLDRLHGTGESLLGTLGKMPAEEFRRVRSLKDQDVSPQWVIQRLHPHESAHRGQRLVLRRFFMEQVPETS